MHVLVREGYRLFFPWSALVGLGLAALWGGGFAGAWPLPMSPQSHGIGMIFGVWGAAVLGFLLTAYPRQNEAPPPSPRVILVLLALHAASVAAILPIGEALGLGLRVAVAVAPWCAACVWSLPIAFRSLRRRYDGTTAAIPVAFAVAGVSVACFLAGAPDLALRLGIHGFAVFSALAVLDRVLPFFSSRVCPGYQGRRLPGFVPALGLAVGLRVCLPTHPWVGDLALLGVILRQAWGWAPWPAAREPMIGVLHLGLGWLVVGYVSDAAGAVPTSLAAHAWLVGGLGTLWAGFTLRVARGHGGLPVRLGLDGALILVAVQLAAALRILAGAAGTAPWVYAAAAGALVLAWGAWLTRVGPLVTRHV